MIFPFLKSLMFFTKELMKKIMKSMQLFRKFHIANYKRKFYCQKKEDWRIKDTLHWTAFQ